MTRQNVASLAHEPHTEVCGIYRASNPTYRVAKNQSFYRVLRLVDISGQINGYAWYDKYKSAYFPEDNDIIRIVGRTKVAPTTGFVVVTILEAEPVPRYEENPIALLPFSSSANVDDIRELAHVIDDISSPSLKHFLKQVFSDDDLAESFVYSKASLRHHHSQIGGLLRHSLECVRMINHFSEIPVHEREVGIVAALLHDLTKTKQFYNDTGYSTPMINHDARTLEYLSVPLRALEQNWHDGAGLLRMIMEYPLTKKKYLYKKFHVPAVVDLVWFVDQLSTAIDMEESAYTSMSCRQHYTKFADVTYWRPKADNYQDLCCAA
jgi:hypothetical protein